MTIGSVEPIPSEPVIRLSAAFTELFVGLQFVRNSNIVRIKVFVRASDMPTCIRSIATMQKYQMKRSIVSIEKSVFGVRNFHTEKFGFIENYISLIVNITRGIETRSNEHTVSVSTFKLHTFMN